MSEMLGVLEMVGFSEVDGLSPIVLNVSDRVQARVVLSKGFGNPRGTWVRVWRVGVRVWNV
jgi:hypothetical protein